MAHTASRWFCSLPETDMTNLASLFLASLLTSASPADVTAPSHEVAAPQQGPSLGFGNGGTSTPRGGTPEPGLLLLLSGGGIAYGALKRRGKNKKTKGEQ